jgi:hypothetical protein
VSGFTCRGSSHALNISVYNKCTYCNPPLFLCATSKASILSFFFLFFYVFFQPLNIGAQSASPIDYIPAAMCKYLQHFAPMVAWSQILVMLTRAGRPRLSSRPVQSNWRGVLLAKHKSIKKVRLAEVPYWKSTLLTPKYLYILTSSQSLGEYLCECTEVPVDE